MNYSLREIVCGDAMNKIEMTDGELQHFENIYLNATLAEASKALGLTIDQVRIRAQKYKIIKPKKDPPNKKHINIQELKQYYETHTLEECAVKFGLSAHQLGCRLKEIGLETGKHYKKHHLNAEEISEYLIDHTIKQCAQRFGTSISKMFSFMKENGIRTNRKTLGDILDIREVSEYYRDHTLEECGDKFGCSGGTIRNFLVKNGADTQNHFDDEFSDKMSEIIKNRWKEDTQFVGKMAVARMNRSTVSKLQLILYSILDDLGVEYYREYEDQDDDEQCHIGHHSYDCVIPNGDKTLVIECQGEYWHSLEHSKINDRLKRTEINKYEQYELKYIWEHEFYCKGRVESLLRYWLGTGHKQEQFNFTDVEIKKVKKSEVELLISKYHYLHSTSRCGYIYGAYLGGELVAACIFSPLSRYNLPYDKFSTLELSRFCINPKYQKKNFASWMISRCISLLPERFKTIISYADTTFNHDGTMYKASNFELIGQTNCDYWYVGSNGEYLNKHTLYNRARKMKITEREYADRIGYKKIKGLHKNIYRYERR